MEILRPGTLKTTGLLLGQCLHCRCLLRCTRDEATVQQNPYIKIAVCYFVKCPTEDCGKTIELFEEKANA